MTRKSFVLAVGLLASIGLHAQQKTPATPKTPWGDPDNSGVRTIDAAIRDPMQRPERFNRRAEPNEEEFKDKQAGGAQTRNRGENAIGPFRHENRWLGKT